MPPVDRTTRGADAQHSPILGQRALNRALLERQMLLRRVKLSIPDALEHLVGLQAQAPDPPYYGLWTRLEAFNQDQLSQLIKSRQVVRIALMRSTIHLVTARDCLTLRPMMQSVHERGMKGNHSKYLTDIDMETLAAAGRALVEEKPRTFSELGELLSRRDPWIGRNSTAIGAAIRTYVPLVQVPPRGLWGESGQATHTSVEAWLGKPLSQEGTLENMIERYLSAFGPASVKDMQAWSGLTRLKEVTERLRPRLRVFRDENGNELFDLPDAPLPDPNTPAPPRFLAEFDNMLLSYDDRIRIIPDEYRAKVFTINGIIRSTILIDGFVCGMWKINRQGHSATLVIELFKPLSKNDQAALVEEGTQLLKFGASDYASHDIQFTTGI